MNFYAFVWQLSTKGTASDQLQRCDRQTTQLRSQRKESAISYPTPWLLVDSFRRETPSDPAEISRSLQADHSWNTCTGCCKTTPLATLLSATETFEEQGHVWKKAKCMKFQKVRTSPLIFVTSTPYFVHRNSQAVTTDNRLRANQLLLFRGGGTDRGNSLRLLWLFQSQKLSVLMLWKLQIGHLWFSIYDPLWCS